MAHKGAKISLSKKEVAAMIRTAVNTAERSKGNGGGGKKKGGGGGGGSGSNNRRSQNPGRGGGMRAGPNTVRSGGTVHPPGIGEVHPIEMAAVSSFGVANGSLGLPVIPSHDTIKATARCHSYMTANANGECLAWVVPTLVSDRNALLTTDASYVLAVGGPPVRLNTTTVGVTGTAANCPVNTATFDAASGFQRSMEGRIASVGFRVTAQGRSDENAGVCYVFTRPNNSDCSSTPWPELTTDARTVTTSLAHSQTLEHSMLPSEQSQLEMGSSSSPWATPAASYWDYTSGAARPSGATALVRVSGATPGYRYYVELIEHLEYVGGPLNSMATPNDVSPQHMDAAHLTHAVLGRLQSSKPDASRHELAAAHADERIAGTAFKLAASAGVPGAGLGAAAMQGLESKRANALTKALLGFKRK